MVKFSENLIRLKCKTCSGLNYFSRKNKKTVTKKLELKKYCPKCLKHTVHQEAKK